MATERALKECQAFVALSDAELKKIAGFTSNKQYEAGAVIFQEGDSADELLVLQEGKIALQMTLPQAQDAGSRRITLDVVSQHDLVGWSALTEPHVYTLTAVCLQKVAALSIIAAKLRELLQGNPEIGYKVLKGLIAVVASRLSDTRQLLISERLSLPRSE